MRLRNLLFDGSQAKVFTGVANTASANATNLVAGVTMKTLNIPQGTSTTSARVSNNIGGGVNFVNNTLLISITVSVITAPTGLPLIVNIKKGATYATAVSQAIITIPIASKSAATATAISILPGTYLFYDVTQVGTPQPGVGLSVTYAYYTGY